jgi:DNA-directed RNA polymerase specialized sigma24 family protein
MNKEPTCWMPIEQIDFDSSIPRNPTDPFELFAYCCDLRDAERIHPLVVRFVAACGKYLVVCEGSSYGGEGMLLEAGKKIGLSLLPCRVVGDYRPRTGQEQTPSPPSDHPPPGFPLDPARLESVFRDLLHALAHMARAVRRRTHVAALRVADDDDWRQEALLSLWRELREREKPRLSSGSEVRKFVFGVLRKQAVRAMKLGGRVSPLPHDWSTSTGTVPDELIAAGENRRVGQAVEELLALIERASAALGEALSRFPAREAMAVEAWLDGAGYRASGSAAGLTLARVRRLISRLRSGPLASLLCQARWDLEALYRASPSAAGRIKLGRLTRLLAA